MLAPRLMSLRATKYKENKEAKSDCVHATLRANYGQKDTERPKKQLPLLKSRE